MQTPFLLPTNLRGTLWRLIYRFGSRKYDAIVAGQLGYSAYREVSRAYAKFADPSAGPILDVGCGTGLTGKALAALVSAPIDGIDLSPEMVAMARQKQVYRHLFVGDLRKPLPISPQSYAGAVSSGVFTEGHVGVEALDPVLEVLAPGAIFALTVLDHLWQAGFEARLNELAGDQQLEIVHRSQLKHFATLKNLQSELVVLRMAS